MSAMHIVAGDTHRYFSSSLWLIFGIWLLRISLSARPLAWSNALKTLAGSQGFSATFRSRMPNYMYNRIDAGLLKPVGHSIGLSAIN